MSSSGGSKKTKRRIEGLFKPGSSKRRSRAPSKSRESPPPPILGRVEGQNETTGTSHSIDPLNTPTDSYNLSSFNLPNAPTSALDISSSSIGRSGVDGDVDMSSNSVSQAGEESLEVVEPAASRLEIKPGLKIAGRFTQTILKKLPDCIDSNPVKMALSIVKTIIAIKDEIGDNKDALTEALQSTSLMLDGVLGKMDSEDSEDVKREIETYRRKIGEHNTQLVQITQELQSKLRNLDYENYKKMIVKICKTINETTTTFMLTLQIEIRKTTAKVHEQIKREQKERQRLSLRDLNPSRKADHKAVLEGQALKRETCTEGTRVKILQDITMWANDDSANSPRVFWLTGQAGSGKTTVIYTIAKLFENGHPAVLGSNFLCSRQFEETRSLSRIIPTIAYQLAGKCEPYEAAFHAHVQDKCAVLDHDISEQIQELLVEPWNSAKFPDNKIIYLIVIDALDEINEDGGSRFLSLLLATINHHRLHHLKFLVTSRTNPEIVRLCNTFQSKTVCRLQDVPIEEAGGDIEKYLWAKLPKFVGTPELDQLRNRASGLFIYAATAVRILTASRSMTHKEQMRWLSNLAKSSSLSAVGKDKSPIDSLYEQILYNTFSDFLDEEYLAPRLRILFTYLCSAERISPPVAATLTDDDEELARSVVDDLHSVLYIQDDRVFWYHASFPDFIMDEKRSKLSIDNTQCNFWCNQAHHHFLLASSCFRIMACKNSGLQFNIARISSSYLLDSECANEISTNIKKNISPALRYACLHWSHHLTSSSLNTLDIEPMNIPISNFLKIRVLFWLEAMNLLKLNNQCVPNLHQARRWVSNAKLPTDHKRILQQDLLESANFATYFIGSPASESTPHLYISSLATWKSESTLTKNWRNQFSSIPHFIYSNTAYDVPLFTVDLKSSVNSVAFSNDGTQIVAGLEEKTVQIIDASTGKAVKVLTGHTKSVHSVSFSNDDKWIASGSYDGTVRLWETSTGTCLKVLEGHTNKVTSVAISPNDKLIATGSKDFSIWLWDASIEHVIKMFTGHTNVVNSVAFSMDNTRIVSGSDDYSVRIWDVSNGQEIIVIKGHTAGVTSVAFTNDNTRVVSGSGDNSIWVWDATTGVQLEALEGHREPVTSFAVLAPAYILSGSRDKSVRIWDMITGYTLNLLKGHPGFVHSVGYSSDPTKVVSGSSNGFVRVWNLDNVLNKADVGDVEVNTITPVTSVAFSSDGRQIIFGSEDGSVRIWDTSTHRELRVFRESTEWVTAVAVSSSGSRFGWATSNEVWVWDASKQAVVMAHRFHYIKYVGFSKEDKLLALASDREYVEMWDESTGVQSRVATDYSESFNASSQSVNALSLSPDGQQIVAGSYGQPLKVWEVSSGKILHVMRNQNHWVTSLAFSDDASCIVSGSIDGPVRVWDALTGSELKFLHGHKGLVHSVAFTSGDTRVVFGSSDSTVRIWNLHTGKELSNLRGRHTRDVNSIAVSSDSRFVISGSRDGSVIIWGLETPSWYLADTNWILSSPTKARLMWVPPSAQVVQRPNCRILVGESLYSTVDFQRAMLAIGPAWEKCYTPNNPSTE